MTRSKTKSADNQQNQQLEEQYKRALADYHNLQKRVEQERLALALSTTTFSGPITT